MTKRAQIAKYVAEMSAELADIAKCNGFDLMEHMLRLAEIEAKRQVHHSDAIRCKSTTRLKVVA